LTSSNRGKGRCVPGFLIGTDDIRRRRFCFGRQSYRKYPSQWDQARMRSGLRGSKSLERTRKSQLQAPYICKRKTAAHVNEDFAHLFLCWDITSQMTYDNAFFLGEGWVGSKLMCVQSCTYFIEYNSSPVHHSKCTASYQTSKTPTPPTSSPSQTKP
jgi:hypothetical protein